MQSCPIRTNPEWVKSVEKLGEMETYYRYILNDNKIPNFDPDRPRIDKDAVVVEGEIPEATRVVIGNLQRLVALREDTIKQVIDKINQFSIRTGDEAKDMVLTARQAELEELLKELTDNANVAGLIHFAVEANGLTYSSLNRVKTAETLEELQKIDEFSSAFDNVGGILNLLRDVDHQEIGDIEKSITQTKDNLDRIKDIYRRKEKELVAKKLVEHSTIVHSARKLELQQEFKNNPNNKGKSEKERDTWVSNKLGEETSLLNEREESYIMEVLSTAPRDISWVTTNLVDARNTNDRVIHLATVLLDKAHYRATQNFLGDQVVAVNAWEKYHATQTTKGLVLTDPLKFYEDIIEVIDGKPTNYLTRRAYSTFYSAKAKYENSLKNATEKEAEVLTKEFADKYMNYSKENLTAYNKETGKKTSLAFVTENTFTSDHFAKPEFKNPSFNKLAGDKLDAYNFLVKFKLESDAMVPKNDRLGYRLPSITKGLGEQLMNAGVNGKKIVEMVKQNIADTFKTQADDEGLIDTRYIKTDAKGNRVKKINVYFRGKIDPSDQSYDLFNLMIADRYVARQYSEKAGIEPVLKSISNIMATRQVKGIYGNKKVMVKVDNETVPELDFTEAGIISNSYKRYESLLADRLYGITGEDVTILGLSANKMASALISRSADLFLSLKWTSVASNFIQGKVSNMIHSAGSKWFTPAQQVLAEKKYASDSKNNLADVGRVLPTSKTNLLMRKLNITSVGTKDLNLLHDSATKRWFNANYMSGGLSMGEHWIAATLMYARLSNVKVMNKDKKYINSKGEVVENREDAMSLDEAYEVKDGKLELKEGVVYNEDDRTTSMKNVDGLFKTGMKIKDILDDFQGGKDPVNKAHIQKYWYGKLGEFLRGWMGRSFQKRYMGFSDTVLTEKYKTPFEHLSLHDRFHSENQDEFKEGTYTSLGRFVRNMYSNLKDAQMIFSLASVKEAHGKLTKIEQDNIKAATRELLIGATCMVGGYVLMSLALGDKDDPEDDNKVLAGMAYLMMRESGDVAFLTGLSVNEDLRMFSSPTATVRTITETLKIMSMIFGEFIIDPLTGDFELDEYTTGRRKGQKKLISLALRQNAFYRNVIDQDILSVINYLERDK
jgi:hypothetical protein